MSRLSGAQGQLPSCLGRVHKLLAPLCAGNHLHPVPLVLPLFRNLARRQNGHSTLDLTLANLMGMLNAAATVSEGVLLNLDPPIDKRINDKTPPFAFWSPGKNEFFFQ